MLIAKYTCNASGIVPTFHDGYVYEVNETENNGIYTVEITSEDDFSSCSFNGKGQLLTVEYLKVTSKVTNMSYMFNGCKNLTSLNVSNFDTSNVTNMLSMFQNCNNLTSLDLSNFDTSKVTNMRDIFCNCNNLTALDLSNWNTSNVNNMIAMFYGCTNLTSLDVSSFDTQKVTDMSSMFFGCGNLTSLDLSNFNTSKVTNMYGMFNGCKNLTSLNLSNFNTDEVTNMYGMFFNCTNLTSLDLSNFDTGKVTSMSTMFRDCTNLTTLDVSSFNTSKVTNMQYMFDGCAKLTSLDLSNFDTSNVDNMAYMFNNCINLTLLDVSNFDTKNVTTMQNMFNGCNNLNTLDVSSFDTKNVTNMINMFFGCNNLTSLDLSNFDTSKVTNMQSMFQNCRLLTSLVVSNFDTNEVTNMNNMFYNCTNLTSLDVSNFDTDKVTTMGYIFYNCTNLTSLDLSNFDTSEVTTMRYMFSGCTNLTSLDVSNFDTKNVTNMNSMFDGCKTLTIVGLIYADINTINQLPTPSTATLYIDGRVDQTTYTGSSKLKAYEQRTVTINIPTALRSNEEIADRIYWNDEDKHYYIEQNINPNTNETLETPNIIASGIKQPIYLKTYENMLSVGISNIDASYMNINVPFFEIPTDYEYKWEDELDYIKQSFELRFPDEEDVPNGWGFMGIPGEEGTGLKALIDWVGNCKDEEFVRDFDQHFNRDYTLRYFLLVITLGMVDNLGKNMMLDTWDNKIFMPRFYDCDTICSYDNSGQLKFDVDIEMAQGYWNTSSSRLWTRIRDLMHDELVAKYNNMRQNGLSYESLMECFYDEQIAKIPQKYYNQDYDVKYAPFADSYIGMANGDTYEHLKRWLQQRLRFVDSLYDYAPSYNNDVLTIRANTTEPMTLEIETYTPVYQHLSWYNNQMDKKKIDGKTSVSFTGTAMAETDQEVLIYGGSNIKSIKGITSMNPNRMLIGSATRLIELDAPNCPLLADINANKANLAPHTYLNKVNLSGCPLLGGNLIINQSPLIREIDIRNTAITGINLPSNLRNLEILRLPANIPSLILNDASQLHTLEFEEGGALQNVSMTNCNALINVTNFDLSNAQQVTLNNSYNTTNELYLKNASTLSLSNMSNLEKVIYTPNAEHETFDITNLANTKDYNITTFNCPKLTTFMTTAPYRESYKKEYGEVKPNEVFEANTIDISSTQFTEVKLLCTTDTNVLKLPQTVKNLIIDSAYDLDTNYLTDGDYDYIHADLYEPYNTNYVGYVSTDSYTPNLIPSASDGSLIFSMYVPTKTVQPASGVWDLKGLELEEYHTFGLNNDVKIVDDTLTMPDRYDEYSIQIKNTTIPNEIARYTASDWNTFPIFNSEFIYTYDITQLDNETYYYSIMADSMDNLPTRISFISNSKLLTVEYLNVDNVTTMISMFDGCNNLTSLDVSSFDTSKVTNMISMFRGCNKLTSLDVSSFDTSKVTNMGAMFQNCNNLTSLDVSNFNTSEVSNMQYMFQGCNNLTSLDVSNFDTSNTTTMSNMFNGCTKLTSLDVSNFDTSKVNDMNSMFSTCTNLTSLDVSNFDTGEVTNMHGMFYGCNKLTSLDVSSFDTSKVTNMGAMFQNCNKLTSLDVSNWNTGKVTNMQYMFYDCNNLTSLDVSNFDTKNVTNMNSMFQNCTNLTSLDVSNWGTQNVTRMSCMFQNCKNLTSLDVSNFNTSEVTIMQSMFYGCKLLTSLDVSNFDTGKVTNMGFMFSDCNKLTSLDVSDWDTSNVTNMNSMFSNCHNLTSLNLSNFDTGEVTNMHGMFYGCNNLTSLDSMQNIPVSLSLSPTKLDQTSLVDVITNLATVTTTQTLTLGATLLAKLTDEQIAVAVNKGWTVA